MYPTGNNYNNPNPNQQLGFNVPPQVGYPNQNPIGYSAPQIGFNVGQYDYNQYQAGYPPTQNAPYGANTNTCPYQNVPSMDNSSYGFSQPAGNNMYNTPPYQTYAEVNYQQRQPQSGGYQSSVASYPPQEISNWSYNQPNQQHVGLSQDCSYPNITPLTGHQQYNELNIDNIGSGGEIYRGTMKPYPNFNVENDCNVLRKAMKGIGTDEKAIIECLGRRCLKQRLEIKKIFKTMFGKDLIDELKSELSGDFRRAVTESLFDQDYYDAYSLRKAMEGAGTRENVLTEILTSRSNQEIENIKVLYKKWYNRNLEKDVVSETSGFYKRVLVSCLQANKNELTNHDICRIMQSGCASVINIQQAKQEAQELFNAGEKKLGTDEACFIKIFALRNKYQLRATFEEYKKIAGRDIFSSIDREMSGDLASSLKAIAMHAVNTPLYFATRLYKSMKGAGTIDNTLIRILLTRSEIDLENIKIEFQKQYGKSLDQFVRSDTSGDYQKFLLRFVEGN